MNLLVNIKMVLIMKLMKADLTFQVVKDKDYVSLERSFVSQKY